MKVKGEVKQKFRALKVPYQLIPILIASKAQ